MPMITVSASTDISVLSSRLENETQAMAKWFADNSMKANADKFLGIVLPGSRNHKDDRVSMGVADIVFFQKIMFLVSVLTGNLILMNMSIVFAQKLVPKSLLYNGWRD